MRKGVLGIILLVFFALPSFADTVNSDWWVWLKALRKEALSEGIRAEVFDKALEGVQPSQQIKHLNRTQPEKRLTFLEYRNSRIDAYRILLGQRAFKKRQTLLSHIESDFQVNPCVVIAIWGMESSYGGFKGNFPVIKALATLAYQSHRKSFFRNELLLALKMLNDDEVTLNKFKGEWAGASGHCQFLPSSWYRAAVDYDGDGEKDIWDSIPDALASIAHYLQLNDWHPGEPWAAEVKLPEYFNTKLFGYEKKRPLGAWLKLGVKYDQSLPKNLEGAIIMPEGGPPLLVFHNFNVIKTYNNSTFYAGSLGYLADKICLSR